MTLDIPTAIIFGILGYLFSEGITKIGGFKNLFGM